MKLLLNSIFLGLILFSGAASATHAEIRYNPDGNWYCARYLGIGRYEDLEEQTFKFAKQYFSEIKTFERPYLYYAKKTRDVLERFGYTGDMLAGVWIVDAPKEVISSNLGRKVADRFANGTEKFIVIKIAQRIAYIENLTRLDRKYWPQLTLQQFILEQPFFDREVNVPDWGSPILKRLHALVESLKQNLDYHPPI